MILLLTTASEGNTALGNTIVTMLAFIILLLVVKRFAWSAFMNMLEQRRLKIQNDLDSANADKESAANLKKESQDVLASARQEANQIILAAKKQSLQIQDNMVREAKEEVDHMRHAAKVEISQERSRIMNELKVELSDISIEIAEKILFREITDQDHHRIIDEFINGMDDAR